MPPYRLDLHGCLVMYGIERTWKYIDTWTALGFEGPVEESHQVLEQTGRSISGLNPNAIAFSPSLKVGKHEFLKYRSHAQLEELEELAKIKVNRHSEMNEVVNLEHCRGVRVPCNQDSSIKAGSETEYELKQEAASIIQNFVRQIAAKQDIEFKQDSEECALGDSALFQMYLPIEEWRLAAGLHTLCKEVIRNTYEGESFGIRDFDCKVWFKISGADDCHEVVW